ncbi:hypothetical protein Tco_0392700 [Tanacetum coccineum]
MTKSKSFNKSPKQRALYHALMESIIEDEDAIDKGVADKLKKRKQDDADKDEGPFARSDRGLKRQKTSKDNELSKKAKLTETSKGMPLTPDSDWNVRKLVDFRPPQTWISKIYQEEKPPLSFDELMSTPIDFSGYVMNNLKINNLTQEHLVRPDFNLLKGTCRSHVELEYNFEECRKVIPVDYFINNDLEYLKGGSSSKKYTTSTTKPKAAKYDITGIEDMVPSLWSPVKFKEGDFPRLHLHDIEDMLLLLVQKKLSNLEKDVILYLGVALQMSDISNRTPYTAYNNPQGIIYLDKYNRNKLMCSDELYKFSDRTLTSVRTVLHNIASNLRMYYLPKRR